MYRQVKQLVSLSLWFLKLRSRRGCQKHDRPAAGTPTFDVLGWCSAHAKIFSLMSKAAKKFLAIQATSCASKRTIPTGGAAVTIQKTKLGPTNVHYLVYCKKNFPKIKLVRAGGRWWGEGFGGEIWKWRKIKSNYTCFYYFKIELYSLTKHEFYQNQVFSWK